MLALSLLLVGCHMAAPLDATPTERTPPVTASVPADPGTSPSPYDAQTDAPDIAKRASNLDLETLGWKETTYHVEVDLTSLGRVPSGGAKELMVRFAADPRWRVGVWDGAVVAFQREVSGSAWRVPRHGFHADAVGVWRNAVRFTPWRPGSAWSNFELVSQAPSSQRSLDLPAFELLGGAAAGLEATALTVSGHAVAVDLFEATEDRGRPRTSMALSELPSIVERLSSPTWKPGANDSGRTEPPHLDLRSPRAGVLEFKGRVAATSPGWTWVRVLDEKGRTWEESAVGVGTRQLVWASPDEDRRAYVQSELPVPSGPAFQGTAEVWHAPIDGGAAKRLAAYSVSVPAR